MQSSIDNRMADRFVIPASASRPQMPFHWGPVVAVHEVGPYMLVEHHPEIFKRSCGTGTFEKIRTEFHLYIRAKDTNHSYRTLDEALADAIAIKHDGINTRAGIYFIRSIGADKSEDSHA